MELKNCIIYKADGGLGHSLKGLTNALRHSINKNMKLYIYGFKSLHGFEEYFNKYFYYKNYKDIEEIRHLHTWTDNKAFIEYFIHIRWNSGLTCFDEAKNIYVYCMSGPMLNNTCQLYVRTELIQDPLLYYNKTYSLGRYKNHKESNTLFILKLKSPYYKNLRIVNKTLNITDKDSFYKEKKELDMVLEIQDNNNKKKSISYKIKENETIEIKNIVSVIKAVYGIKDKKIDIIQRVKSLLNKYTVVDLYDDHKIKEILHSGNYISVHFRNRDKQNDKYKILKEIKDAINKHKTNHIYIATDDPSFFDFIFDSISDSISDSIFLMRYSFPPSGAKNIHFDVNNGFKKGENLYKALVDIYWCQSNRCKQFIGCINSSFTNAINYLNF
jgi:hypothetical protein